MPASDIDQEKARLEQELRIQRQIAFASGLFQGDVTVRTLLESLAEGVVIIDNSGTILLVNSRAEQMFGYPKKDLIGKPHIILIPELFRKAHKKHEAQYFAEPRIRPMGQLLDLAGRRRDGSEFPVEISLSFMETVNGVLFLAFISDITLRKQYETRLRESEELFHIQVEGVKDYAIFMLDPQGNVLNWNAGAERLKGYGEQEIIGKHFSCFYTEEERNAGKPEEELKIAAVEGRAEDEGWRIRKDGSRFWADVIITALHDENGKLQGFSKVTRDITARKRAEEKIKGLNTDLAARAAELEAANRELETFNYTVAHDLRKPLTVINGYYQALMELCNDKLDEACKGYLREAYDGTLRMNRLIDALLNLSRLAHVVPRRETADLSAMAHEVASELKRAEPGRRVTFLIADGVSADGDAGLLRVVMNNLLGNAWKYTGERDEGIIEFGTTEVDGNPAYFIRDNGTGFDMAEADKLFIPFQRLAGAEECMGFGIGLATVERIIRRHGGRVWAEGAPGKGACFYFTLPSDAVSNQIR